MVVYLDLAFLLNCTADAAALYVTARLAGLPVRRKRVLLAGALGGVYGALCAFPPLRVLGNFFPQIAVAFGLVLLTFGRRGPVLRELLLFILLSCTLGGAMLAFIRLIQENGGLEALKLLDWRAFFVVSGMCYLVLSVVFRGGARHAVAGELCPFTVELDGKEAAFTALLDTGHTLTDPATGEPVLIAQAAALDPLWSPWQRAVLARLEEKGAIWCLERLGEPGRWRLLSYRAVGVSAGLLLCFRADRAAGDGEDMPRLTVAISPTPVSDGGGYTALWGGGREADHYAA